MKPRFSRFFIRLTSYVLFLVALSITSSCKKDDGPDPNITTAPACKVMKITDSDGDIVKIDYDSKDRIVKITDDTYYLSLEYDNDNRITKISDYDDNLLESTRTLEYNAKNQWVKMTVTEPGVSGAETYTAEYDASGMRTKITLKDNNTTESIRSFEYANGNLMKETDTYYFGSSSYNSTTIYEYYTDKENKLQSLYDIIGIGFNGSTSKNLVRKETYKGSGSTTSIDEYTYEFNNKGFPTKITQKSGANTDVTLLEYQCN